MRDDIVVFVAFLMTLGFTYGALSGDDALAAAFATGLVLCGVVRLVTIIHDIATRPR
jgi:hypothetical protein